MSATNASLRPAFPLLLEHPELVYLDNAATTQKPASVLETVATYYRAQNANVHRAAHTLSAAATSAFERARRRVAEFLNAPTPDSIVWTRGTTEAINLIAHSYGRSFLARGDVILVSELEHHANIVPWQQLCAERGCELRVLPIRDDGTLDEDAWDRLFDDRVKLLAITGMSNVLGVLTPLPELIRRAHAVGARVLVDAAQLVVHAPIDVQALDCDFLVFSGHKLYAPTGVGVLYGKPELLDKMPPWQGGGEMIETVSFAGTSYQRPPFRFEAGTPNIGGVIGLAAAIDFLAGHDRAALLRHEADLLARLEAGIDALPGLHRVSRAPGRAGLVSFRADALHVSDIASLLDARGIAVRAGHHCAMPLMQRLGLDGTVRASLAVYSTEQDVDRLLAALADIVRAPNAQADTAEPAPAAAPDAVFARLKNARGWEERYRCLMQLGKEFPVMSASERDAAELVPGCESKVWLALRHEAGALRLSLDSDARIVRGLLALVHAAYDGKTAAQIRALDIEARFAELDLLKHLSPSRGNGLLAIVRRVRTLAGA